MDKNGDNKNNQHGGGHHILPLKTYFVVWGVLIFLTVVTVGSSYIDLGGTMNILVAMLIATIKALCVVLIFMGLKYDSAENNITFFMTFLFLVIFVVLTGSDMFYRRNETAAPHDALAAGQAAERIDVSSLINSTPDLIVKGKTIFGQQCIACHGAGGLGDGPAAASLNPKPRNFTKDDGWKNGRTAANIFNTLTYGVGGMPAFGGLSGSDRFALVHYVRSLMSNPPQDTPEAIAELEKKLANSGPPKLAVAFAMNQIVKEESGHGDYDGVPQAKAESEARSVSDESTGAALYKQYCITCHGAQGQGGIGVQSVGVDPALHFITRKLSEPKFAGWQNNKAEFEKLVSQGLQGSGMPGFAQFTAAEWQELYEYVKKLAAH